MKIGLDISQSTYKGTGSARYTVSAISSILKYERDNDWIFFFSALRRKIDRSLEHNIHSRTFTTRKYIFSPTMLHYMWNVLHNPPIEIFTGTLDWFITSDWTQPPAQAKVATIVHDLAFIRYPEVVTNSIRQAQEKRLAWAKKESDIFLALSQSTSNDLQEYLQVDEAKIKVLYPAVTVNRVTEAAVRHVKQKFKIQKPFIFAVGKIEPRKNLKNLIEAFNNLNNNDFNLIIVGPPGWEHIDKGHHRNIIFTGLISDDELYALYQSALFFVSPSIWEGFGYPVVEAMLLDCPVTCSNISSLKEIGEGATLQFNPHNIEEITEALQRMIDDEKLRKDLVIKGREKSKIFNEENYYNNLISTLRQK